MRQKVNPWPPIAHATGTPIVGISTPAWAATTPEAQEETQTTQITGEMAFEGVNSYCHSNYDWSIAEENPEIMYVAMGDESETEYKVIFRSYTGSFVHFDVDKASGNTRMVEVVPSLDIENEVGTFNLFDYLDI